MVAVPKPPRSGWIPARLVVSVDGEGARVSPDKRWLRAAGVGLTAGVGLGLWYLEDAGVFGAAGSIGFLVGLGLVGGAVLIFDVFFAFTNTTLVARRFARQIEIERTWLGISYSTRHVDVSECRGVSVTESVTIGGKGSGTTAVGAIFTILGLLFSPAVLLSIIFSPKKGQETRGVCAIRIRLREGGAIITHRTYSRRDCHEAVRAIREALPEFALEADGG